MLYAQIGAVQIVSRSYYSITRSSFVASLFSTWNEFSAGVSSISERIIRLAVLFYAIRLSSSDGLDGKRHVYIFTLNYIAKITIYHFFAVLKNAYSAYPAEYLPIRA